LRLTGFRTYGAFVRETTPEERAFIAESIQEWHNQQGGGVGGL
jgi:hypothetical protein